MRVFTTFLILLVLAFASLALTAPSAAAPAADRAVAYFTTAADSFAKATQYLHQCLLHIDNDSANVAEARKALVQCRLYYKRIEFFLTYFFFSESTVYNGPPKYEIEEPYMEYQHPAGMQVIEALLYETEVAAHKKELLEQAELISSSANDISSLLYGFKATDAQLLESMRLELIRVITLHITGYDAPLLKSGIAEAEQALASFQYQLQPFAGSGGCGDSAAVYVTGALHYLHTRTALFDSFDRLHFLTAYLLPLQAHFASYIAQRNSVLQTAPALNYRARHLFSNNALQMTAFGGAADTAFAPLVTLGRQLFFETALSGNNRRSCASCHQPDKYFADELMRSQAFDGKAVLPRNTPGLLYACYQHAQFWDGRAASLEQQVKMVLQSAEEMNADTVVVVQRLQQQPAYIQQFAHAFPQSHTGVTLDKTTAALAAYLRTLCTMSSPFDRYIQGDSAALTAEARWGFNLFMGKAQCGTCHFAPVFNGLTPPLYQLTEFEVPGTTASGITSAVQADADAGRYQFFPISFYKQAFKTPTVRNVAKTAPYMHNGGFATLDEVVEFYNKGGGVGLGLTVENQTLSATPLNLTEAEKKALVRFMEALTDDAATLHRSYTAR